MAPDRTEEEMRLVMHLCDRMVATGKSIYEIAASSEINPKELEAILTNQRSADEMKIILTKCRNVLGELYNQDPPTRILK